MKALLLRLLAKLWPARSRLPAVRPPALPQRRRALRRCQENVVRYYLWPN